MGRPLSAILFALTLAACRSSVNESTSALASDEWTRSFTPVQGAAIEIVNRNGGIEVEGTDADRIEVRAERRAKASSDQVARDVLAALVITDTSGPGGIVIRTEGVKGMLIGASWEVDFHVQVPRTQAVRLRTSNGSLTVRSLGSHVTLFAGNGEILATDLRGGVDARTTNGRLRVALSALTEPINLRATNGRVDLVLPDDANALVQATAGNGQVEIAGLTLDPIGSEQTSRRVRGRLGAGRIPVDVSTTNGAVRISNPASAPAP